MCTKNIVDLKFAGKANSLLVLSAIHCKNAFRPFKTKTCELQKNVKKFQIYNIAMT
jgi:hypothetical protein